MRFIRSVGTSLKQFGHRVRKQQRDQVGLDDYVRGSHANDECSFGASIHVFEKADNLENKRRHQGSLKINPPVERPGCKGFPQAKQVPRCPVQYHVYARNGHDAVAA